MLSFYFLALCEHIAAHTFTGHDPRLQPALTLNTTTSGVSTTPDGRLFIIWNHIDGSTGPFIGELVNGQFIPYPDEEWNLWNASDPNQDPNHHFLKPNAQRIGPDGLLWVVDNGGVENSKLVSFNITTNSLARVYSLENATLAESLWDDVRFNGNMAYLTDAGAAAIGILDLTTGQQRRVLEYSQFTTSWFPASAEGVIRKFANGSYQYLHVDQLEVSPDGVSLHFRTFLQTSRARSKFRVPSMIQYFRTLTDKTILDPLSGGFWRISTSVLDRSLHNDTVAESLGKFVEPFASIATTGGTAIDRDGNIYSGNTDLNASTFSGHRANSVIGQTLSSYFHTNVNLL